MSTEDLTQTGLRVGGWLPPYQNQTVALRPESRPVPYHPAAAVPSLRPAPAVVECPSRRGGGSLVCLTLLAAALAGLTVTFLPLPWTQGAAPRAVRLPSVPVLAPEIPVELPASSPSQARDLRLSAVRRPGTVPADPPAKAGAGGAPVQTRAPQAPPRAELAIGATIGLELSGRPGYRVRHRNFLGRVDRIDSDSSALDRADSRFIVRAARANGCVALESVNYPGRFLRHRNFVLHLDRWDGTSLFTADSTFCPVSRRGGAVALRSYNYPDRFITEQHSSLALTSVATSFVVRSPL